MITLLFYFKIVFEIKVKHLLSFVCKTVSKKLQNSVPLHKIKLIEKSLMKFMLPLLFEEIFFYILNKNVY